MSEPMDAEGDLMKEASQRMLLLLDKFKNDSITLSECYELRDWIQAIQDDRLRALNDLKLLVSLVSWSLGDKIKERGGAQE